MAIAGLGLPPWAVLGALLGIASAALFHLLFCSQIGRLPLYLLIGTVPALLGGLLGTQLGPTPWSIGEAHLLLSGSYRFASTKPPIPSGDGMRMIDGRRQLERRGSDSKKFRIARN